MNNKPSLESQFLVALLAFTTLLYGNVWLMAQSARPAETNGYAVNMQPAKGTLPDLSSMSREEVGEYLVQEVKKQLNQPNNYFAAAAAAVNTTAIAPIVSSPQPTPTPQTQQFQQPCNTPFVVRDLSSLSWAISGETGSDFVGPRSVAGSASEYYFTFIGTLPSPNSQQLYAVHLGQDGMTYNGTELLFRGQQAIYPNAVTASGRFIVYVLERPAGGGNYTEAVVLRYLGPDGRPGGGDDTFTPILDLASIQGVKLAVRGTSSFSTGYWGSIHVVGGKLGVLVSYDQQNIQARHLLLFTLAQNGTVTNVEVPTAATIMRQYPTPTYGIVNFRVAETGAVILFFTDPTGGGGGRFFDFMHPGADGLWNNGGDEQRVAFGETQPTTLGTTPEISEDGQFVAWDEGNPTPIASAIWRLYDAGPDKIPGTGDPGEGVFNITPPGIPPNTFFATRGISGNMPATPSLPRPSAVRIFGEQLTIGAPRLFQFFESGPNQIPGDADDIRILTPSGPQALLSFKAAALASEGNVSVFTHDGFARAEPILRGIRLCYQ